MSALLRKHMPLDSSSESESEFESDKGRHAKPQQGSGGVQECRGSAQKRRSPMLMQHWAGIDDGHVRMWQEDEEDDIDHQHHLGHSQSAQLDESIDTDSLGGSFDSASAEALLAARTRPITAAINTLRSASASLANPKQPKTVSVGSPHRSALKDVTDLLRSASTATNVGGTGNAQKGRREVEKSNVLGWDSVVSRVSSGVM